MKIRKVSTANAQHGGGGTAGSHRSSVSSRAGGGRSSSVATTSLALAGRKKKEKKLTMDDIIINPQLIYAERELWSPLNNLWKRYRVFKPRLPHESDQSSRWVDSPDNSPRAFNGFIGDHNKDFFSSLHMQFQNYETTFSLPEIMVITGPSGSGKSSIMKIFVQKLIDEQSLTNSQSLKWYMHVNAMDYANDMSVLWARINKFAEPNFEKFLTSKFRLILIDNFQYVSPSTQQQFKKLYMTHINKLKYIFISPDPKATITSFFLSKAITLRTNAINERDALSIILSICYRNRIGYELEGIKAAFEIHNKSEILLKEDKTTTNTASIVGATSSAERLKEKELQYLGVNSNQISMSLLLDLIQKVFVEKNFISKENVYKVYGKTLELPIIKPYASIEPFERCSICTLYPPCSHITVDDMNELGLERRAELPSRPKGSIVCPEFKRYGRCTMFNLHGHCSLHHPKKIHGIEKPIIRCTQCTIPWPCNHCSYTSHLSSLQSIIDEIKGRLGKLRSINVPEPPAALIRHLENVPGWKEEIARLDRVYVKTDNLKKLKESQEWLLTAYCTDSEQYDAQAKVLMDAFGDLLVIDLLNSRKKTVTEPSKGVDEEKGAEASLISGWNESTIATED